MAIDRDEVIADFNSKIDLLPVDRYTHLAQSGQANWAEVRYERESDIADIAMYKSLESRSQIHVLMTPQRVTPG